MSASRILKYTVPVGDFGRDISLGGPVIFVGSQRAGEVQFWVMAYGDDVAPVTYHFRVIATGQPIPPGMFYVGTAIDEPFVWHLFKQEVR